MSSWYRKNSKIAVGALAILGVLALSWTFEKSGKVPPSAIHFASTYPANQEFQTELTELRSSGKLKPENEAWIQESVATASTKLNMPPAVLWCLLFQESRLNHLSGVDGEKATSGIGQFSYFSTYEINHHLDRYGSANLELMVSALGSDIRPLETKGTNLHSPSSYYFIPTGVVSSAAYLNNQYLHLAELLKKRKVPYDRDLLWIYAAMAYNKGTRSVLSLWNDAYRRGGNAAVERLTNEPAVLFPTLNDPHLTTRALRQIWSTETAKNYSQELRIHIANLKACALGGGT